MLRRRDNIDAICEMMDTSSVSGTDSGAGSSAAMTTMPAQGPGMEVQQNDGYDEEPDGYTEEELRLAKRFIELAGSPERAQELVQKVSDCEDCLDIIDDGSDADSDVIGQIADAVPDSADLPSRNPMVAQFNPGSPTMGIF